MANPEPYDFLIIGAGQCAVPLAQACAAAGRRTALVEREHVGGTCVNEGCTPTKTMVASARVAYLARRAADYGIHTNDIRVDLASVRDRKRSIVDEFRGSSERRLNQILGCAVLGIEGGEIMSALQIAIMAGLPYPKLRDGIFAHPTLMESLNNLFTYLK